MKVKRGARAVETEGLRTIERAQRAGPPRDEYNELQAALKRGRAAASSRGHTLTRWKRRPYAPATAATAFCRRCRAMAVIDLEKSSRAYGPAVESDCRGDQAAPSPPRQARSR